MDAANDVMINRGYGGIYGSPYDASEKYRVYSMVTAKLREIDSLPEPLRNRADMQAKRLRLLADKPHGTWKSRDLHSALRELGHGEPRKVK